MYGSNENYGQFHLSPGSEQIARIAHRMFESETGIKIDPSRLADNDMTRPLNWGELTDVVDAHLLDQGVDVRLRPSRAARSSMISRC